MKLFDTLKNIWKIEELKTRILTTLGLILVYRLGTEVVLPGIDPAGLAALKQQTSSGVLGLLDMFSGGAFSNASIFALGIQQRLDFRARNYALYLCFYRSSVSGNCGSLFSAYAA